MVDLGSEELRQAFGARLNGLLDKKQVPVRGRAPYLRREMLARGGTISVQGVSKWLSGASIPEKAMILRLADLLDVSAEYIEWGAASERAGGPSRSADMLFEHEDLTPVKPHGSVPLISWIAAGALCDAEDPYPIGGAEEFIPCPEKHSASTFALRVDGPSMDDGTPRGYRDGEIIYVDPEVDARHNSDVIVRTPGGKATFKRLQETAEGRFLVALNKDWPERIIRVPEGTEICGVVIGSYTPRSR